MIKTFPNTGDDFSGLYAAKDWLQENDFAIGSPQRDAPLGIKKDKDSYVPKWGNMDDDEIESLDGKMTGNYRNGTVTVELYNYAMLQTPLDESSPQE